MTSGSALEIVTTHDGPRSVLQLRGELDLSNDDDVRMEIRAVMHSHDPGILVLDLSGLAFTDSTGLGTMVWAHKRMAERGHQLLLADPNPLILRLLRISGLDRHLTVVSEEAAAEKTRSHPIARGRPAPEVTRRDDARTYRLRP